VTLAEALLEFEELRTTPEGHAVPFCCGLPVVQNSQDGVQRILCTRCGRTVRELARQWCIEQWGSKGITRRPRSTID